MAFQDNLLDLGSSSLHASCESSSTLSLQCHLGTPNTTNHAKSQDHDDDRPLDLTTDEDTLDSKNDGCSIGSHATTDATSDRSSTPEEHPPFSTDDEDLTSSHPNPAWHTGSPQPLGDDSSILTSDEFASTTVVILGREFLYYQNAGRFVSWDPIDAHYHTCLQLNRKIFQLSTRSSAKTLFHAPLDLATVELESEIQVLDVGAGDGSWARDFLAMNSNAIVYAVDLHGAFAIYRDGYPNYPEKPNCPENLNPEIDDLDREWTYQNEMFHFIRLGQVTWLGNIETVVEQCYRCNKKGGWTEFTSLEVEPKDEHTAWKEWMDLRQGIYDKTGRAFDHSGKLVDHMTAAGFVNVHQETTLFRHCPTAIDVEGLVILPLYLALGWDLIRIAELVQRMERELSSIELEIYCWVTLGKRP